MLHLPLLEKQLKSLKALDYAWPLYTLFTIKAPLMNYSRYLAGFTTCRPLRSVRGGELEGSGAGVGSASLVVGCDVSGTSTGHWGV